ncbi:hypothetical protein L6164_005994 [Bauhinia variegata]|uniref:Uncharacterized protein n=1 Tax=Bauhinia variegata TaxID=167791 RepID=A0ACB9PSI9_BAUVA|nr:hypothetical protein L6164_005994 [Bauhinia variegata]
MGTTEEAQKSFGDAIRPNVVSYTTMISGYLKREKLQDALELFEEMPERNIVPWSAMVHWYSQTGYNEEEDSYQMVLYFLGLSVSLPI